MFISGEKINLRPLRESDAAGPYPGWLNDAGVCLHNSHRRYPYTAEEALDFIRSCRSRRDMIVLAVQENTPGERYIGNVSLQSIDFINRSAEVAILLGEKGCWGKGCGREAVFLLLRHAFQDLNLHRIYFGTPESNVAMQKLGEALGMRLEGRKRQAFFKNGRYEDVLEYGILACEFPAAGSLLNPPPAG